MRIETTGAALRAAAGWAARIAPTSKPVMPVLACVLLDATEQATVSATDLDLFGTATMPATVVEPGRAAVSARLLSKIADTLKPDAEVRITREGTRIKIQVGRSWSALPELDTELWPQTPDPGGPIGTVPAPELRRALARVLVAACTDDKQPKLQAVVFALEDGLTLAATDRYRLAVADLDGWLPKTDDDDLALIVPTQLLKPALDALKSHQGEVTVLTDGSTITLECGSDRITGRLLADFVRWESILPDPTTLTATVVLAGTEALSAAVSAAALVCKEDEALRVEFGPDGVRVTPPEGARAADDGDAVQYADLLEFHGKPITVRVTPRYLLDALTGLDEQVAEIRFSTDPGGKFLLRPAAPDGEDGCRVLDGYQHVLMPRKGG